MFPLLQSNCMYFRKSYNSVSFMSFSLIVVRYDFTVALICIFSMINNNPHYLTSQKCSLKLLVIFKMYLSSLLSSLHVWGVTPPLSESFTNVLPTLQADSSLSWSISITVKQLFSAMRRPMCHFFRCYFIVCYFGVLS